MSGPSGPSGPSGASATSEIPENIDEDLTNALAQYLQAAGPSSLGEGAGGSSFDGSALDLINSTSNVQDQLSSQQTAQAAQLLDIVQRAASGNISPEEYELLEPYLDALQEQVDLSGELKKKVSELRKTQIENSVQEAQDKIDTDFSAVDGFGQAAATAGEHASHAVQTSQKLGSSVKGMKQKDDGTSGGGGGGGMIGGA